MKSIASRIRPDFLPKDSYLSREWLEAEKQKLWPKVWQIACRAEEVKQVGDYVTYNIADESIIVVRASEGRIEAFYNVCQHRGRRLAEGCGRTATYVETCEACLERGDPEPIKRCNCTWVLDSASR